MIGGQKMIPITVVMVNYNPEYCKLMRTLKSIIMQKGIDFQLVVADDGSAQDYFDSIKNFCDKHNFANLKFVKSDVNVGTVKNYLNGIIVAEGKYIRGVSPGDFLYDEYTVRDIYNFMNEHNADVCFGNIVYYTDNHVEGIKTFRYHQPYNLNLYTLKDYNQIKVKYNYYILGDWICGGCVSYSRSASIKYLSQIQNKIKFAEDYIISMMIFDEIQVYYLNRYVLWYEYGAGISTTKNIVWQELLSKDHDSFFDVMFDKYGEESLLRRTYRLLQIFRINNKIIRWIFLTLLCPSLFIFTIKKKSNKYKQTKIDYDLKILKNFLQLKC